jgi:hypothetical protein
MAKELSLESKFVLTRARELGISAAKVPSSQLDKITAEFLEEQLLPLAAPQPLLPEHLRLASSQWNKMGSRMAFDRKQYKVVVASDVSKGRDGIGVEIYRGDSLLIEIFRDDTKRTREITTYTDSVSLDEMEGFIQIFKQAIPWEFID